MELFRSLAVLAESPRPEAGSAAAALGFGGLPTEEAFTELFSFELYPYASVYLGSEGMIGGEARDRIAGFWRALDQSPPGEPDHLAVMLAAYAELAERESEADGGSGVLAWRRARSVFFWEHLATWLPAYLDRAARCSEGFYRRWAELLAAALAQEAADLEPPARVPLHFREAPDLGSLDDKSADEALASLLTPIRTGMILVRRDLARCARSLGLGLRAGERRFALRSLLAQAPAESLRWLASEAADRAEGHRRRVAALRPVSAFWEERARSTSESLARFADALGE